MICCGRMVARSQNGHVLALPGWEVFNLSFWKIVLHPISFNRYAVMLAVFLCESFAVKLTSLMLLDGSDSVVIHIGNVRLSVFCRTNHECSCQTWSTESTAMWPVQPFEWQSILCRSHPSACHPHVLGPTRTTPGRVWVIWGILKPGRGWLFEGKHLIT